MRVIVIGTQSMAQNLSARYGVPFFAASGNLEGDRLEQLRAAPGWIAVAPTAPEQEELLSRADAVMICLESRISRLLRRLFGRPERLPAPAPEQILRMKQICPHVVITYGQRAALRYPESAGLADGADFV